MRRVAIAPLAALAAAGLFGQSSLFVGSRTCAACHADIYKKQDSGNHARSLRNPGNIDELFRTLPFPFQDRASQVRLTMRKGADNQLELAADKEGEHESLTLRWAFGSGIRGITLVGLRRDGTFAESRLSWYPSDRAYSLTPGATRNDPQTALDALGRTLTAKEAQECFSCHTTDYTPGPSGPVLTQMGIHCERCHGPGLEHSRLMAQPEPASRGHDRRISNPGRLEAFAQIEMCGACHGHPPRDTDLAALRFIEQTPQTARFPSRRLVLSRCFNESDGSLKCTLCHDPHTNVAEQSAQRDRSCLGCHTPRLRAKASVCPVSASNCVTCHMPRQRVMLHSEFTDHWIRVVSARAPGGRK